MKNLRDSAQRILFTVVNETSGLPPRDVIECLERVKRDIQKRIDALYEKLISAER